MHNKQRIHSSFLPLCTDAASKSPSPWTSHIRHILQAQELTTFAPDFFFKNICIINNPGRENVFLWSKAQTGFVVVQSPSPVELFADQLLLCIIKDLSSLSSAFLSIVCSGVSLWRLELKEPVRGNAGTLVTGTAVNHKVLSLTHRARL